MFAFHLTNRTSVFALPSLSLNADAMRFRYSPVLLLNILKADDVPTMCEFELFEAK